MTPEQKEIHKLRFALYELIEASHALNDEIDGVTDQFDKLKARLMEAASAGETLLKAGAS